MTYNGCKRWFNFSKIINGEPHEYKQLMGKFSTTNLMLQNSME